MFSDKLTQTVAEAAKKVMEEELKGKQHKIDVAEPKGKITGADLQKLRTMKKEDVEQVDEAEKWIQKAIQKPGALRKQMGVEKGENIPKEKLAAAAKEGGTLGKRARLAQTLASLPRAKGPRNEEVEVAEEQVEELTEKTMTDTEMKKREEIVKSMKKNLAGFKERYGSRAKDVMYATATKQAMKEMEEKDVVKEDVEELEEGIEDRLEAARAKAKAAGKTIKEPVKPKSNVRKVAGHSYGGSAQKPEKEEDDEMKKEEVEQASITMKEAYELIKQNGIKALREE